MCIPIPDGVSDEQAVLADPFSVSLHGILKRPPTPGSTVLVYGCGTLGLLAIAILRGLYPETRVLAVARFPHQKALAERFGAALVLPHEPGAELVIRIAQETGAQVMKPWYGLPWLYGGGVEVVYDTVGLPSTIENGLRVAASRGAIVVTGVEVPQRFEWTPLYFKRTFHWPTPSASRSSRPRRLDGDLPGPSHSADRLHADPHPPLPTRTTCESFSPAATREVRRGQVLFTYPPERLSGLPGCPPCDPVRMGTVD